MASGWDILNRSWPPTPSSRCAQHGPVRGCHRIDPTAGLHLGTLCAAAADATGHDLAFGSSLFHCGRPRRTLSQRKAQASAAVPSGQPAARVIQPQTLLGLGRGLLSWSQCPLALTAVVNCERDEPGQTKDWVLVSTTDRFSAAQIRSTYELRPAIEERHRQYKCFWDLTRMHSCVFSLVVNQALMVLLAYTLLQAHLVLRQRQQLTGGIWERTWQLLSPTLEVVAVY